MEEGCEGAAACCRRNHCGSVDFPRRIRRRRLAAAGRRALVAGMLGGALAGAAAEAGVEGKSASRSRTADLRLEYIIYGILWPHSFLRLASLTGGDLP